MVSGTSKHASGFPFVCGEGVGRRRSGGDVVRSLLEKQVVAAYVDLPWAESEGFLVCLSNAGARRGPLYKECRIDAVECASPGPRSSLKSDVLRKVWAESRKRWLKRVP